MQDGRPNKELRYKKGKMMFTLLFCRMTMREELLNTECAQRVSLVV